MLSRPKIYTHFQKIFLLLRDVFDVVNDLRIHIIFTSFLTYSWFLSIRSIGDTSEIVEYSILCAVMTGFAYLFNRYTDYSYDLVADKGLKKAPRVIYIWGTVLFLLFGVGMYLYFLKTYLLFPIVTMVIFGYIYSAPTIFKYPLKNYLITKPVFNVLPKTLLMVWGLYLFTGFPLLIILILCSNYVLTILIHSIVWDIRDINADIVGNVKTIPNVYGKEVAVILCLVLSFVSYEILHLIYGNVGVYTLWYYAIMLLYIFLSYFISTPRFFHAEVYFLIVLKLIFVNREVVDYFLNFFEETKA